MMGKGWHYELSNLARKQLSKLDPQVKNRILAFLDKVVAHPDPLFYLEPLHGRLAGYSKIKAGDYRIVADAVKQKLLINCVALGHRKESYEQFTRTLEGRKSSSGPRILPPKKKKGSDRSR